MQGIFRKENTDKALKYGIYRHLPTYEKIIRNLVSFYDKKYNIKGAKKVVLQYSKNKKKGYKSTTLKTVSIRKNTSFYIRIAVYYVKGKSTYSEPVKIKG